MTTWILLVCLILVWILWLAACMAEVALSEAKRGVPEDQRRGVSIFPGFPIFPLLFWAAALAVDLFADPWGTYTVGALHGVLGIVWAVSTVRNMRALKTYDSG